MANPQSHGQTINDSCLADFGLSVEMIRDAIEYTHNVLDQIDHTLVSSESDRLADLIELANLSAIVGNLFRRGIATVSNGTFRANRPHTFPDLLANAPGTRDLEIKSPWKRTTPRGISSNQAHT